MSSILFQLRRGTAAELAAITPGLGEPCWTTDTLQLFIGDGSTTGGISPGFATMKAGDYKASDGSSGISTTITTASLVGKTITIKNGLITGFA